MEHISCVLGYRAKCAGNNNSKKKMVGEINTHIPSFPLLYSNYLSEKPPRSTDYSETFGPKATP